jgi:hypothetical protein
VPSFSISIRIVHDVVQPHLLAFFKKKLLHVVDAFKPDIVIFEEFSMPQLLLNNFKLENIPTMIQIHDIFVYTSAFGAVYKSFASKIFHDVNVVLTLSQKDKTSIEKLYGMKAHWTGATLHKLSNASTGIYPISQYTLKPAQCWLFPSGPVGGRGTVAAKICIDAFKDLPDETLVITGSVSKYISCSLANVKVLGFVSNEALHALYENARGVLAPVQYPEGIPTKVIDALNYAKPCIVLKDTLNCFRGLISGHNIVAIQNLSADEIVRAVKLLQDPQMYQEIREGAKRYAVEELSWSAIIDRIIMHIPKK